MHLIYISTATSLPSEDDLEELLKQSRVRNLRQNITGMLLYSNATYLQVLEGESKDVHEIYDSILNDPRNTGNIILLEESIKQRDFPTWTMGFKNLENFSPEELPGFINIFSGKIDKDIALARGAAAVDLLLHFAKYTN